MQQTGKQNVIIYGLGNTIKDAFDYIKMRFSVIGCSDSNIEKKDTAQELRVLFVRPDELCDSEFDYILITSIYDDEIYNQLIENRNIPKEKVLRRQQWCRMIFQRSFGMMNQNKTFYVLSRPIHIRDGLFSFLFSFLEQLDFIDKKGYIPVIDMQNYRNQYLEEDKIGIENAWEYYFNPVSEYRLEDVYKSANVILGYDDPCYKTEYEKKYNIARMSELYQRYIKYRPDVYSVVQREYVKLIDTSRKTLGILYRGSDMSALKLKNHPVQPTIDEMIYLTHKYMEEWHCERIFLSTEDGRAADRMKAEFGAMLSCTNQRRFKDTGTEWLADIRFQRQDDKYLRGLEYLVTIELLSKCDCFLAGICAGSVCAQIMNNGKYQHMRMVDKGEY
ncbi:hypothetical protein D7X88_17160 [bacterium C-53]|nr:hypothetical protein [Lachnospiraceae bacterium]NBI04683.1 hypothetical protein [Lachnospiraceae bacterium]RKJ07905.1 hypothetical protein D7X88_17160 [bacterium C-53]